MALGMHKIGRELLSQVTRVPFSAVRVPLRALNNSSEASKVDAVVVGAGNLIVHAPAPTSFEL